MMARIRELAYAAAREVSSLAGARLLAGVLDKILARRLAKPCPSIAIKLYP
jgi:hypothetical protein